MKLLIGLALVLCVVMAERSPQAKEIAEVRDVINQFAGTTLIILYDAGSNKDRFDEMIKDVQKEILTEKGADKFNFFKTEVPVDALKDGEKEHDPERFIDQLKIDAIGLKHAPTLVVTRKGWAYWAHGDGAVADVKKELKSFDAKARASNPHALKKDEPKPEANAPPQ